ncbi:MAG: hypothetical protein EPN43_09110 [Jatrophihabitans sp.]|nr:MAG: hypothetical protein EPN43_09110 [Jatrophihabitans sp.]
MNRGELRSWIEDALARSERDARERGETVARPSVEEIVDAVWGRLPLEVRRQVTRAQVQAGLTVLTALGGAARSAREDRGGITTGM